MELSLKSKLVFIWWIVIVQPSYHYGFSCKRHISLPWQELCCIISSFIPKAFCLNFTSFFATGGRQFKVTINDTIVINRIDADTGERIRIEKASTRIWCVSIHWNRTIMKNMCRYLPLTISFSFFPLHKWWDIKLFVLAKMFFPCMSQVLMIGGENFSVIGTPLLV